MWLEVLLAVLGKMPPPLVSLLRAVVVTPFASPGLETWPFLALLLLGPPAWELQTLTVTTLKPFCRLALCQNPVGSCAVAAGPQHQAHFPQPHILKPGQDLIRWPQAGGGSRWGGKAFANLLLNHRTIRASIRLSGTKCTETTYLGSARQPGAVMQGEVGL